MSDIETRLKEIVAKNLDVDKSRITPDSSYVDDLGADSLDTVELIMAIEEEFGVEIPDEEAEKVRTIADTLKYITEHAKEKAS
jgi:acyl carrier protein